MNRTHSRIRRVFYVTLLAAAGATITILLILVLRLPGQFQGLKPGDLLPCVRLVSPEGKEIDTRSWRGRPTLLMLFDLSCPACLAELDNIDVLAPTMPGLRVALLCNRPREGRQPEVATYLDPTGKLTRQMRRFAVPAVYWISPDGRVEYARSGARSLAQDASIFYALFSREGVDATAVRADNTGASCR